MSNLWNNIFICSAIIITVLIICVLLYKFFQLETSRQVKILQEWLLLAVVQAEKELGSGTGQIKLRYVYDMFLTKFTYLPRVITFQQFSLLVEVALLKLTDILQSNNELKAYIEK